MSRRGNTKGRDIHGILLLDKPAGITSNDALQLVKRLYDARKVGHTGSLDKPATGLLPLCFGDATKFSSYLLDADKHYQAICNLGSETTTGDAAGDVLTQSPVPDFQEQDIEQVLKDFRGEIQQVPPMFSALKHKGQRLYELAYQGLEVERAARPVTIHRLRLLKLDDASFEIDVVCSKGTYIRTLAEDIGKALGCGAHVGSLRRLGAGPYSEESMIDMPTLDKLAREGKERLDSKLRGVDTALFNLPEIILEESVAFYVRQGQAVTVPNAPTEGLLRIYNTARQFIGLGEVLDDGRITPRRLVKL
ncbi:MAG: tRNA pseudouridine55 synthase [Gammaproteobacteria bacterium]|jgi:tRNA pseudouridine55 synthase